MTVIQGRVIAHNVPKVDVFNLLNNGVLLMRNNVRVQVKGIFEDDLGELAFLQYHPSDVVLVNCLNSSDLEKQRLSLRVDGKESLYRIPDMVEQIIFTIQEP